MTIDHLEEARVRAARVAGAAQLQAIVLRDLQWMYPEQQVAAGLPIELLPAFEAELALPPGLLVYKVTTDIRGLIPDNVELFRLVVTYQLVYSVDEALQVSQEEAEAFGSVTVMFQVFPYVREILQNLAGRAGVGQILLQPIRVPFVPSPDDSVDTAAPAP